MALVRGRKYGGTIEILRHKDFTAIPVTVSKELAIDNKVVVEEHGRKIVKAGAILGGGVLAGGKIIKLANDGEAEGVLRYDVDITDGDREASMVIRGEVFEEKLPEELSEEARKALATRILFIK